MNNYEIDVEEKINNKAALKDIAAICIAVYEILAPILIVFFLLFSLIVFFILNIWLK